MVYMYHSFLIHSSAKVLNFDKVQLRIFSFDAWAFGVISKKSLLNPVS